MTMIRDTSRRVSASSSASFASFASFARRSLTPFRSFSSFSPSYLYPLPLSPSFFSFFCSLNLPFALLNRCKPCSTPTR